MYQSVCTLVEKDYFQGLAVLANSLNFHGYKGNLWAGYRGDLPSWATAINSSLIPDATATAQAGEVTIIFVKIETTAHFTNFKPQFMLQVLDHLDTACNGLLYLDPDITLAVRWSYIQEWMQAGVALCEDVNSPHYEQSPRRTAWRQFFNNHKMPLTYRSPAYINAGCCGVRREHRSFLQLWERIQELIAAQEGGLHRSIFDAHLTIQDSLYHFNSINQDGLNCALEATDLPCSILNKAAMALNLTDGSPIFPHSLGKLKPWRKNYSRELILNGIPPTYADKMFWLHARGPLLVFSKGHLLGKRLALRINTVLSRIYRRAGS